jgi:hypothetical protein
MDVGGDVGFTISNAAEAVIRDQGGELWIWAGDDGRACASRRAPGIYGTSFTTYTPDSLVIRVDDRIVPPWRWRFTAAEGERAVEAAWDGLDPRVYDRRPLEEPRDMRRYVFLAAVAIASALAFLWFLHLVRVTSVWFTAGHLLFTTAVAVVGGIAWLRKKHAERRADQALDAELQRNPLPLRRLGKDQTGGGELG